MLLVEELVTPSPEQFDIVIKGMRHPFKSTDKSDSQHCTGKTIKEDTFKYCLVYEKTCTPECDCFILGEEDKQRLLNLCSAGDASHRKLLRQLPVIMNIKAPLYWWKQVDQYKIGTVTDAESTMHSMTKYPFKIEDFSVEHLEKVDEPVGLGTFGNVFHSLIVSDLNYLRDKYIETNDKDYWYAINELLPHSYLQTRCWSGNYETLVNIINQRKGHPLREWRQFIDYILENVPYLKEISEVVNES